jgi:hypothetical protein
MEKEEEGRTMILKLMMCLFQENKSCGLKPICIHPLMSRHHTSLRHVWHGIYILNRRSTSTKIYIYQIHMSVQHIQYLYTKRELCFHRNIYIPHTYVCPVYTVPVPDQEDWNCGRHCIQHWAKGVGGG